MAWIKTVPKTPGTYHVATRVGEDAGIRYVIEYEGEIVDALSLACRGWKCWWWDVPVELPPPPPWDPLCEHRDLDNMGYCKGCGEAGDLDSSPPRTPLRVPRHGESRHE